MQYDYFFSCRSVPDNQRSYALGLQLVLWRALGSLPAPVIFGSFIDRSCILWRESCGQKGDCLAYKAGSVVNVIISSSLVLQGKSANYLKRSAGTAEQGGRGGAWTFRWIIKNYRIKSSLRAWNSSRAILPPPPPTPLLSCPLRGPCSGPV